jgi:hypothetical protein
VIAFNWAVSPAAGPLPALLHHNVFLSGDFRGAWRRARAPEELAEHPNFYLHVRRWGGGGGERKKEGCLGRRRERGLGAVLLRLV